MGDVFKSDLCHRIFKLRSDDDGVDRLSRLYTVVLLVFCGVLIGANQFFGNPISCWCPAQFTDSHRDYTDSRCWASGEIYSPIGQPVTDESSLSSANGPITSYHRWVPLILLFQALVSFAPCYFWRFVSKQFSVNLPAVMDAARRCSEAENVDIREDARRYVVDQMNQYLLTQHPGCVLLISYLAVKLLYVANAIVQLIMLSAILYSDDYFFYWVITELLDGLIRGQVSSHLQHFPSVMLCEFEIRHQSRLHHYIVQCSLPINQFNAKIFLFFWFWFVFLITITIGNALLWLLLSLYSPDSVNYLRKHLRLTDATRLEEASNVIKFTKDYMSHDGVFIVRLVGKNFGEAVAREVVCGLWNNYSLKPRFNAETECNESDSKVAPMDKDGARV